ncbi:hypothetical protein SAMN05444321_3756 [Bradyrhizobium lablabi]|nr:hypothetical protein SAMN05444321_3756 [Bradyrhizobium lablabi]
MIFKLRQRPRRRMYGQISFRCEQPKRYIRYPFSNQFTFTRIPHPDDEIEIARGDALLLNRRRNFEVNAIVQIAQFLYARQEPMLR